MPYNQTIARLRLASNVATAAEVAPGHYISLITEMSPLPVSMSAEVPAGRVTFQQWPVRPTWRVKQTIVFPIAETRGDIYPWVQAHLCIWSPPCCILFMLGRRNHGHAYIETAVAIDMYGLPMASNTTKVQPPSPTNRAPSLLCGVA